MQARNRSSGDGTRSHSFGYRNYDRGGFSRGHFKSYAPPPPLPRLKADILLEAGRLAADYLFSQGLLSPSSLPGNQNHVFQETESQDRELEGRGSALSRLGSSVSDSHGRRRFDDEHNHAGLGRRRGPNGKSYGRDGRDDRWTEKRSSRYSDDCERKDDYTPRYHRERRRGLGDVASSASRGGEDERNANSESGSENHEVADDTGSKTGSSSTRKVQLPEVDVVMRGKRDDDDYAKVATAEEKIVEVKSETSAEDKGSVLLVDAVEGDSVGKYSNDLLKLCSFARMPTRPRSSLALKRDKVKQSPMPKKSDMNGVASVASKAVAEDEHTGRSPHDLYADQDKDLESEQPNVSGIVAHKNMDKAVDLQNKHNENPLGFGTSNVAAEEEDVCFEQHPDLRNGIKRKRESTAQEIPEDDDYANLDGSRVKLGSMHVERIPSDEGILEAINQAESDGAALSSKAEADAALKLNEEKKFDPTSFKTCDLNLMESLEITEITDDTIVDTPQTIVSIIKPEEEAPSGFSLSIGSHANGPDLYNTVSGGDKVIPIIDLEDDSTVEETADGSSKPKNDMMYSGLENFLSHTDHADDLHGIQDCYPLAISEFMGNDIPGCPSVSSDLNKLQTGLDLHSAEAAPGVYDSIHVSFEELPLGFMDTWDQPPREFGKFF